MSAEIVRFPGISRLDLDPQRVLETVVEEGLQGVVVLGYDAEGEEYFACSYADGGEVLWLLERMKLKLLRVADDLSR